MGPGFCVVGFSSPHGDRQYGPVGPTFVASVSSTCRTDCAVVLGLGHD